MGLLAFISQPSLTVAVIERVTRDRTRAGDKFIVHASTPSRSWAFETFNPWLASACQIAHDEQRRIELRWKRGNPKRWGGWFAPTLTHARILR